MMSSGRCTAVRRLKHKGSVVIFLNNAEWDLLIVRMLGQSQLGVGMKDNDVHKMMYTMIPRLDLQTASDMMRCSVQ